MIRPKVILSAALVLFISSLAIAQTTSDALSDGFVTPPDSAKPRAWWHWTGGNITKEGITKDMEWMKRVGIGGCQLADGGFGGGQTIDKPLPFMSPEWLDAVHHAASEADRLGLELSIFSSDGWSESGGPWVKPEQAMKKLVWSEMDVVGPKAFNDKLPQPPSSVGAFGNQGAGGGGRGAPAVQPFYADSVVVAYPTPTDESNMADAHPKVTSSGGTINAKALMDGDMNTAVTINTPESGPAWLQYEFEQPYAARSVWLVTRGTTPIGRIACSDDGKNWKTLVELPGAQQYRGRGVRTYDFPQTSAKFYRVEFTSAGLNPAATINEEPSQPAGSYSISELVFNSGSRVNRWEDKAGFDFIYQYETVPTPESPASGVIPRDGVIELTGKMAKDGTLTWDVPAGKWTIVRLGYSLTGAMNRPSRPEGLGLEVDKLSKKYVQEYYHGYTDRISAAVGPLWGKSLRYMTMDSWEAGMQNWTDEIVSEFQKRRGYDPTPYLPALLGRVVGSADISDRFLWDFRRTIEDLEAENHWGTMQEELHKQGLGLYAEAQGVSMEMMEDTLLDKKYTDIPMGEFWVHALHPEPEYYVDVRQAASAAHIYGKPITATESFTGGQYEAPVTYKKIADYWFAQGVNRLVFHTSAHQPLDTKPGNTMVGTHINRNITWAEQAGPLMTYFSRTSYMLQQGKFVADIAYLLPEGAVSSQPFWGDGMLPAVPAGFDYDCVNHDVLMNRMSVGADGRIVLPDGMSYKVLVLSQLTQMTPQELAKIRELAAGGATIVGQKPKNSPSLRDYPTADAQVNEMADDLWGDLDGITRNRRLYGKGKVAWNWKMDDVMTWTGLEKDFDYGGPLDADINWIHRRTADADIYFVANHTDAPADISARFRVSGKEAELWHSDTGVTEPADYSISGDFTAVPLHLGERESVFVVFRNKTNATSRTLPKTVISSVATVEGPWNVSFQPNLGAPASIQLDKLESWTANKDSGVKYFSGTATYTQTLHAPDSWIKPGAKLWLDLGTVGDIAEITVNGKDLGIFWKLPYKVDVTDALKPGDNAMEIKVTNTWTNRIAGDRATTKPVLAQAAGGGRGFGGGPGAGGARGARGGGARGGGRGGAGGGLPESGLLGPVTVKSSAVQ